MHPKGAEAETRDVRERPRAPVDDPELMPDHPHPLPRLSSHPERRP